MPACETCTTEIAIYDAVCSVCGTPNPAPEPLPDDIEIRLNNAKGLADTGDLRAAAKMLHALITLDSNVFEAYATLSQCYTRMNMWVQAYTVMNNAARLRPGDSTIQHNMGVIAVHAGKTPEEARAHLAEAKRLATTDPAITRPEFIINKVEKALKRLE